MSAGVRLERKAPDFIAAGERLRPLRDLVVIKVLPLALSRTLHAEWSGAPVRGEIIAVGPGKYPNRYRSGQIDGKDYRTVRPSARFRPTEVQVGDLVELGGLEINGYLFPKILIDGQEHLIVSEQDIAIVHDRG